jgi:hypothetical protein
MIPQNPTARYQPTPAMMTSAWQYQATSEPWFRWADVPLMSRDPAVKYGLRLLRSPYAKVKITSIKARPAVKAYIERTWKRFWKFSLPKILNNYFKWGRSPGGVEWEYDHKRRTLELHTVRDIQPFDALAQIYSSGSREGQFAGFQLQNLGNSTSLVKSPYAFWFSGFNEWCQFCDEPRLAAAYSPWLEKNCPMGLKASRRLFNWTKAVGVTVVRHPNTIIDDGAGGKMPSESRAVQIGTMLQNGSVVAVSSQKHPDGHGDYLWDIDQRQATGDGRYIGETVKDADEEIWFGLGIPPEIVRAGGVGSGYSGRAIPMETWFGQADELSAMLDSEFRHQILDKGLKNSFGKGVEYEYEITSLLEDYYESQNPTQPSDPGKGGGPDNNPLAALMGGMGGGGKSANLSSLHAPAGGVEIKGVEYVGGQFIPAEVAETLTSEQRDNVEKGVDVGTGTEAVTESESETEAKPTTTEGGAAPLSTFGKLRKLKDSALNTKIGRILAVGEHKLSIAAHKTRDVAKRLSEQRGHTEEETARLARTLAIADFAGGYVTGAVAGAIAGPLAAKIAMFMPSASAAYLAYSSATDPIATAKAAIGVVRESSLDPRNVLSELADAWYGKTHMLSALPESDWKESIADTLTGIDSEEAEYRMGIFVYGLLASGNANEAANLSANAPSQSQSQNGEGQRQDKQLHTAATLAMIEAQLQGKPELLEHLAELADDPEEAAKAFGSVSLDWIEYGTSRSGKKRWKDDVTKEVRYQKSKPGTASAEREKRKGTASQAHAILGKVQRLEATSDDLRELQTHLPELTTAELQRAKAALGGQFRDGRTRDKMVASLMAAAQDRADKLKAVEAKRTEDKPAIESPKAEVRENGTPLKPQSEHVYTVDPSTIKTDPSRFQYKVTGIGKDGVTDELKGTRTYNPELGGVLLVWRDPETGEDYVINGHHRHELATRTGAGQVNVRYIEAESTGEARAKGALANIAEGRGTATDAAKFMRDTGSTAEEMSQYGISLTGRVAADAMAMKDLSDGAFRKVTMGQIPEASAVAVSKHLKDHALQDQLFKRLEDREEAGKDWSSREIETAAKMMASAGKVATQTRDLFGEWEDENSTFDQEVEIRSFVSQMLNREAADYSAVANTNRADRIAGAGNVLATDENARRRDQARVLAEEFERETKFTGPIADAIREHAKTLFSAKTKKEKADAKQQAFGDVQRLLSGQPAQTDGRGKGSTQADDAGPPTSNSQQSGTDRLDPSQTEASSPTEVAQPLTEGELTAAQRYSLAPAEINGPLRSGEPVGLADTREHIAKLDDVISRRPVEQGKSLFRGGDKSYRDYIAAQIGIDPQKPDAIGKTFTDHGFVSTGNDRGPVKKRFGGAGQTMFRIEAGEGVTGLDLNQAGANAWGRESETLLGRGLQFTVVGRDDNGDVVLRASRSQPPRPIGSNGNSSRPSQSDRLESNTPVTQEPSNGNDNSRSEPSIGGQAETDGGGVAAEAGRSQNGGTDSGGESRSEPNGSQATRNVPSPKPASLDRVNSRLDRFTDHFRQAGQHQVADWLQQLRGHVNEVGVESALGALGEGSVGNDRKSVEYEGGWDKDAFDHDDPGRHMAAFSEAYLNRHGITLSHQSAGDADIPVVSSAAPDFGGSSEKRTDQDFLVQSPTLTNKLEEAKRLPGLERSEDINKVMGQKVTHLTPEVLAKLDAEYGKGQWIVKAYGDEAAAGYGIFFPQRAEQIRRDAQNEIWHAGSAISRYGFSIDRDKDGAPIGIAHQSGDKYKFGSPEYESTINGEVRRWADRAAKAAQNERGASLPDGGKDFMVQPAFKAVGVSDEDRAAGRTIAPGEGRVHIVTRNGKAELIPHSTWIKGEGLPVVFESDDTRAMAQAAVDAINKLPESERQGQIYAPDIIKAADGYRVVEANPANSTGSSGYLGNNPMIIDAYVSHLTGKTPAHVAFIRRLLSQKNVKP